MVQQPLGTTDRLGDLIELDSHIKEVDRGLAAVLAIEDNKARGSQSGGRHERSKGERRSRRGRRWQWPLVGGCGTNGTNREARYEWTWRKWEEKEVVLVGHRVSGEG